MTVAPERANTNLVRLRAWAIANASFLGVLAIILVIFSVFGMLVAGAPGLYMDAINPDYEVVKILHPDAPITVWEAPGDLLFARFPVMFELYAGSYITYWMLPFAAILGDSVLTVRIARVCFGVLFLCCVALLCRELTRSRVIALVATFVLAVDPTFVYGLRTQAYVVLFPLLFVVLALFAIHRYPGVRTYFVAGVLIGLAAFGYFVYLFTLPGVALFAIRDAVPEKRIQALIVLAAGVCIGLLPYALAYGLLFGSLGWSGGLDWLHTALAGLHVRAEDSYIVHLLSTVHTIGDVLSGQWLEMTIWQEASGGFGQLLKLCIVLGVPFVAFLALYTARPAARRAFAVPVLATASFIACATYFGPRLGGHDLTSVVTLSYIAAAVGVAALLSMSDAYRRPLSIALAVCAVTLAATNLAASAGVANKLARDGGGLFYSLAISDIPKGAIASGNTKTPYIFPTWGEMMPFIYETGGTIPAYGGDQLVPAVCRYGSANVVLLGDDAMFPSVKEAFPPPGLVATSNRLLHDPSSGFPYRLATIKSAVPAANCAHSGAAVSHTTESDATPQQTGAAMLQLSSNSIAKGIVFEAQPNPVPLGAGGTLPIVTVRWVAPNASKIEIHVATPGGQLFAQGGTSGTATTGPWVQAGDRFFLQDVSGGAPGKTLSTLSVSSYAPPQREKR